MVGTAVITDHIVNRDIVHPIGIPAYFTPNQRQETLKAAEAAGRVAREPAEA
jgi:hypothetical protein